MTDNLGPCVEPYWTRRHGDGEPTIRLWTGYSWLDFGSSVHIGPEEVEVMSEALEFDEVLP